MSKSKLLCMFMILSLFLTGCGEHRILEKLAFIDVTGQDLAPKKEGRSEDLLLVTVSIPKATPEGKITREVLTVEAETIKNARQKLARQTDLYLVSGQTRNLLFGLDLAKQGVWKHIDTYIRDPVFSERIRIVVVHGSSAELLSAEYSEHPRVGTYIHQLLRKKVEAESIPDITIYEFVRDYYDEGIDPIAPMIAQLENNIEVKGVALFQNDRYVDMIPADDILIFALLRNKIREGQVNIHLEKLGEGYQHIMLSSITGRRRVNVIEANPATNRFVVSLNINLQAAILEYIGELDLRNDQERIQLEQMLARYFEQETSQLVEKLQELRVDSLGMGSFIRNRLGYREWKELDWDEVYPNVDIRCHVQVKIKGFGIFS